MSVIIETFLQCDRCFTNFGVDQRNLKVMDQRKSARANGWIFSESQDYCRDCKQARKDERKQRRLDAR